MQREYGSVEGYATPFTSGNNKQKKLTQWRSGKHAANPAEAQELVRLLDAALQRVEDIQVEADEKFQAAVLELHAERKDLRIRLGEIVE